MINSTPLSNAIVAMTLDTNSNSLFYAHMLMNCKISYSDKLPAPAGVRVTSRIEVTINPAMWNTIPVIAQIGILKHEMMHVIMGHTGQKKQLVETLKLSHKQLNIAMDCAINQLDDLPERLKDLGCVTVDAFKKGVEQYYKGEVKPNMTMEYYARIIKEVQDEYESQGGDYSEFGEDLDDHEGMDETEGASETMQREVIKQSVRDALKKQAGNAPSGLDIFIKDLMEAKVNWKKELNSFFNNSINYTKTTTRSRRNRRYGTLFAGKKKDYQMKVAFMIDTSGSMGATEFTQAWGEIVRIKQLYPDMEVVVIECDAEVQQVREFKKSMDFNLKGGGGTLCQPAIDEATKQEVDFMIYFTDGGIFDQPTNPKVPFLWVLCGGNSLHGNVGFGRKVVVE
jgi:predicted metal-dependent peptidase